ncbi:hypothetical protein M2280_004355 [Prescottella agglutinans]|uniref:Uncharacterized protein n=1 Tax=Prescottella agglutinans TaxID=1644129 RepID=A0ABT6MFM3_9NOCA|nr:hypothetical protein [Prescottella agglutinans]
MLAGFQLCMAEISDLALWQMEMDQWFRAFGSTNTARTPNHRTVGMRHRGSGAKADSRVGQLAERSAPATAPATPRMTRLPKAQLANPAMWSTSVNSGDEPIVNSFKW